VKRAGRAEASLLPNSETGKKDRGLSSHPTVKRVVGRLEEASILFFINLSERLEEASFLLY